MWIRCALLVSLGVTAHSQTLAIPPVTVARGSANIFRIVLKPQAERPITALQWDLVFREGLRIEPSGVVTGAASEAAGKSLWCARRPSEGISHRMTCILAGGVQVLSAGIVAVVRFEAAPDSPKSAGHVRLERVAGVSPSLQRVAVESTGTSIVIR